MQTKILLETYQREPRHEEKNGFICGLNFFPVIQNQIRKLPRNSHKETHFTNSIEMYRSVRTFFGMKTVYPLLHTLKTVSPWQQLFTLTHALWTPSRKRKTQARTFNRTKARGNTTKKFSKLKTSLKWLMCMLHLCKKKTQKSCVEIQWLTLYNMITIIWGKWGTIHCSASNVGKEAFIGRKIRDPV